jgi:carboxymethylenebutenolidase
MASATVDVRNARRPLRQLHRLPDEGGPFPAVLFFMDGFGVRPVLQRMADRIADWGLYVLQPNLFYRARPRAAVRSCRMPSNPRTARRSRSG